MTNLANKIAWITGAGSGIGQAAAIALAGAGASVVLSGRREQALADTARQIEQTGGKAFIEPMDVAEAVQVRQAAANIRQRFGRIDILINNAGINTGRRHWSDIDVPAWEQLLRININGVIYCVAEVLPLMRQQHDGLIITLSSWAGRYDSRIAGVAYGASKKAVLALNASINMEEGVNGIRACAICPAEVATPILDRRPQPPSAEERAKMLAPEDLAATILFVAQLPARACINEILISPTWNRAYLGYSETSITPAAPAPAA